jgi:hypothetical protein
MGISFKLGRTQINTRIMKWERRSRVNFGKLMKKVQTQALISIYLKSTKEHICVVGVLSAP